MKKIFFFLAMSAIAMQLNNCYAQITPIITTIAGDSTGDGGPASSASIRSIFRLACDNQHNLFFTDQANAVKKINSSNIISTIAGGGFNGNDTMATSVKLYGSEGIAVDRNGNVFITEAISAHNHIRKISPSGRITTYGGTGSVGFSGDGGPATAAQIHTGSSVTVDTAGNIYFPDGSTRIRKISTSGIITTVAGTGTAGTTGDGGAATAATISTQTIFIAKNGTIYLATGNSTIRAVNSSGTISLFAGRTGTSGFSGDGGAATSALLNSVMGFTEDKHGNIIFIDGTRIRKINTSGIISTIAGNGTTGFSGDGGPATAGSFNGLGDIATDTMGNIYLADAGNKRIRMIDTSGYLSTIAKDNIYDGGPATRASLYFPQNAVADKYGNIYISDRGRSLVRKIDASGNISTFAGRDTAAYSSGDGGPASAACFYLVNYVALDTTGNLYVAEMGKIRKINMSGIVSTVAGNGTLGYSGDGGPATAAQVSFPMGMKTDRYGNLFFADVFSHRIRKISTTGIITTIAGNGTAGFSGDGGAATAAMLNGPNNIDIDSAGNVFITDANNNRVRKVSTSGIIRTIAGDTAGYAGNGGPATAALLHFPCSVIVNNSGGNIYISDAGNNCIRKINPAGIISNIVAVDTEGFSGDGGPAANARLYSPWGMFTDTFGTLFFADYDNTRIRKVNHLMDHATSFTAGLSASLSVCENSTANSINSLISISDLDTGNVETWSFISGPAHGSTSGSATSSSTGTSVTPTGFTYTPASGYSGMDTFRVRVYDGELSDTIAIFVTIIPTPIAGTITGGSAVCAGATITLAGATTGGTWADSNPSVATISSTGILTGLHAGTDTLTYRISNSCGSDSAFSVITVRPLPVAGTITGTTVLCAATTTTLSDTATGGAWSSATISVATISSSGTVTGISGGTSVISYGITNSCGTAYTTTVVTINPLPAAGTISGSTTICRGSSTTLSTTGTGGSWHCSNTSIATVNPTTGVVSGLSVGADTIVYRVANSCGTDSAYYSITVRPLPVAGVIIGVDSLCIGSSATFIDTSAGGTWSSSSSISATVNPTTGAMTGLASGAVIISYSVTNSCGTANTLYNVQVNAAPLLISTTSASVCDSLLFNYMPVSDSLGVTFSWTRASVSGISNPPASATGSISEYLDNITSSLVNVTYVYTISKNGCPSTQNLTVSVHPTPTGTTSGRDTVCEGDTILLFNSFTGTGTWSSSNAAIASIFGTGSSAICYGVAAGNCSVVYAMSAAGCLGTSTFPLTVLSSATCHAGINNLQQVANGLQVFPNPNTGIFTINLSSTIVENAVIIITNFLGEKMDEFVIATNKPTEHSLQLPTGVYSITAYTNRGVHTSKIVVSN